MARTSKIMLNKSGKSAHLFAILSILNQNANQVVISKSTIQIWCRIKIYCFDVKTTIKNYYKEIQKYPLDQRKIPNLGDADRNTPEIVIR